MKLPSVTTLMMRSFANARRSFQRPEPAPVCDAVDLARLDQVKVPKPHTVLHCARCKSIFPLSAPRQIGNVWYAQCGDCLNETEVEPVSSGAQDESEFRVSKRGISRR